MVERIEISIDGNISGVYLIPQRGLVKVIGGGVIPDREYLATPDQIKSITKRQLILNYPDRDIKLNEY
jgi:hypothetical protein